MPSFLSYNGLLIIAIDHDINIIMALIAIASAHGTVATTVLYLRLIINLHQVLLHLEERTTLLLLFCYNWFSFKVFLSLILANGGLNLINFLCPYHRV